ncbi:hypothetical protein SUGI_0773250 [Cryptomeria japonica]|uniref:uncharacterized protein LOC131071938 n=1 Tax=Cryptomeria japonica TaxID=3369 RepID=UPI0024147080|nr:uncharacterized protein LOC131071938 [Cryptomeria japonica]GLJ37989.1 hypothetical protein SUGI_0773250 [Cryptomeria japonica]
MNEEGAILRQTSIRPARDEHPVTMRQNSIRSRSSDAVIGHSGASSAQIPEANDHYVQYIRGFTDLAAAFNWGVVVLTLGSYGLVLSDPVFWLCWSILVTEAVIFYSVRPYWNWIENSTRTTDESQDTKKPHRPSDHERAGAVFLKVGMSIALITLLLYSQDIAQRQTKIILVVSLSIILFEGFAPILIAKEEMRSLMRNPSAKRKEMMRSITEGHNWNASSFLTPSVINAMICVTGATVLGGNLGSLMPEKPYWIFISIIVVDLMAEAIHRFDCGKRSLFAIPEDLPKIHYLAIILRLIIEGFLCYWMTKEICQDSYFPSNVDINACDGQCQERSKQLLITMVALGGLQAAGTFTIPLCSCVLGPHFLPSILLSAIVFIGYLFMCGLKWLCYKILGYW